MKAHACVLRSALRQGLLFLPLLTAVPPASADDPSAARLWNEQLLAAIRRNVPNPPGHARNLFHTAVAMYGAWAAYDPTAVGCIYNEKIVPLPDDVEAARHEAISYAAYRLLRERFASGAGSATSLASFDTQLTELGYSTVIAQGDLTTDPTPAELGKRVGQSILSWGAGDGFALSAYPEAYTFAANPNMSIPLHVMGTNGDLEPNMPLGYGIPEGTDPNFWQPLALATSVTQNGIPVPGGVQSFVGVQGLATTPFSLTRDDPSKPWIDQFGGPSRLSTPGNPSSTEADYKENAMDVLRKSAQLNSGELIDISPGAFGNNPLGADTGTGFPLNPVNGSPYAPNLVTRGDFVRVLAEFWADGPNSETPPGHWHVLANELSDMPALEKRIRGAGAVLNDLEWDVKVYFALSAATHDAACAAWSLKRYYSGARPITMIRYMGSKGQSSDSTGRSYHPQGLPVEPGVVEVITNSSSQPGERHEQIWDVKFNRYSPGSFFVGEVAVYSWPGEHPSNAPAPSVATHQSTVRWMLAKDWLPFQRKTFNTPAFPGFTSGHSTFSRAAAEALTLITGSPFFPDGFHHHTVPANSMQIDLGPSEDVDLQWCGYYDAADQAGQSRRWGGIHPYEDDYVGRQTGSIVGVSAYLLAEKYWSGNILLESLKPAISVLPGGAIRLTWKAQRGMRYEVRSSTDLEHWMSTGPGAIAYLNDALPGTASGSWIDTDPDPGSKFYQVVASTAP